jgi:hypothetical protein
MSGEVNRVVCPILVDGLFRCSECGYINLLRSESYCPRCKRQIAWTKCSGVESPWVVIRNRQSVVLVVAGLSVLLSVILLPMFAVHHSQDFRGNGVDWFEPLVYVWVFNLFDHGMFDPSYYLNFVVLASEWVMIALAGGVVYFLIGASGRR